MHKSCDKVVECRANQTTCTNNCKVLNFIRFDRVCGRLQGLIRVEFQTNLLLLLPSPLTKESYLTDAL